MVPGSPRAFRNRGPMKAHRWLWLVVLVVGLAGLVYVLLPDGLLLADKAASSTSTAAKPKTEADLGRVVLTDEEHRSLKVRSEPAKALRARQALSVHGFILAPPGQEALVAAPVPGYVRAAASGRF